MTAEIAVLNKSAVALAADSAVTIGGGVKIFQSVNKIFCLSEDRPVAVMIYGRADFIGVPWETIITLYRKHIGKKKFKTIQEYGTNFLRFISNNKTLFPKSAQVEDAKVRSFIYLAGLSKGIQTAIETLFAQRGEVSDKDIRDIAESFIQDRYNLTREQKTIRGVTKGQIGKILKDNKAWIKETVQVFFGEYKLSQTAVVNLESVVTSLFYKEKIDRNIVSGLVMAGFGENEHFPALAAYEIETMLDGVIKSSVEITRIGVDCEAAVRGFAQRDMIASFMNGILPEYWKKFMEDLEVLLKKTPDIILDIVPTIPKKKRASLKEAATESLRKLYFDYAKESEEYQRTHFADPIMEVVSSLPKDELALMAESLVSLTSLKRRVSRGAETVAGPTDVAIISKRDGFVWVKCKPKLSTI